MAYLGYCAGAFTLIHIHTYTNIDMYNLSNDWVD